MPMRVDGSSCKKQTLNDRIQCLEDGAADCSEVVSIAGAADDSSRDSADIEIIRDDANGLLRSLTSLHGKGADEDNSGWCLGKGRAETDGPEDGREKLKSTEVAPETYAWGLFRIKLKMFFGSLGLHGLCMLHKGSTQESRECSKWMGFSSRGGDENLTRLHPNTLACNRIGTGHEPQAQTQESTIHCV